MTHHEETIRSHEERVDEMGECEYLVGKGSTAVAGVMPWTCGNRVEDNGPANFAAP